MMSKYIRYFLSVSVAAYLLLALYYFLSKAMGGGDEALFLSDLEFIKNSGWQAAIQKGVSLPYMLLVYPFSLFLKPFIALRLVNVFLFAGLLCYFFKRKRIQQWYFYALLLFFYSTVGYFLVGTNDTLFIVCMVIFLVETHAIVTSETKSSLVWWGSSIVIAFFTRELVIVYAPVILLAMFFILKSRKAIFKSILLPCILALVFLGLNAPSLLEHNSISYDQKLPPSNTTATWVQRQYHAQLLVNEKKLPNYNHPNWDQTQAYLDANGSESLPSTVGEALFFNPSMTLTEFFKDFSFIGLYSSRQLGLTLPIVLFLFIRELFRRKSLSAAQYIPTSLLLMMCIFALIIISFIELRWLAPVFIAAVFYFYALNEKREIHPIVVSANFLLVGLLSCYGMYGMITKL